MSRLDLGADGRIVTWSPNRIERFAADGSHDATLRGTGALVGDAIAHASGLLEPDGRLVSVGVRVVGDADDTRAAVARYAVDGTPDATFGAAGLVTMTLSGRRDTALAVEAAPDGKTIVAGTSSGAPFLLRVTNEGALDPTFGTDGIVRVPVAESGPFVVDASSRVLMLETTFAAFVVHRYDASGRPDATFGAGHDGRASFARADVYAGAIAADALGRVIVAGTITGGDVFAVRIGADGSPDASFGKDGFAQVPVGGSGSIGGITMLPDGGVMIGAAVDGTPVAIDLREDGTRAAFGTDGVARGASFANGRVKALVQPNGAVVLLAAIDDGRRFVVERFDALGHAVADGAGTFAAERPAGADVDAAGRVYIASTEVAAGRTDIAVTRYSADGAPDATWGAEGRRVLRRTKVESSAATCIRILDDGTLLVGGRLFTATGATDLALAKLRP